MYNPCKMKTIRIAAYSVMYISYSSGASSRVVNPDFYLPLVHFPLWSQMRCREREFLHRPGFDRCRYGPCRRVTDDLCTYMLAYETSAYPLATFVPLHPLKACIRMVTLTYPVLGDSLARCRIRSGVRRQQRRMVRLKFRSPCYAQVLPMEMKFELKDGLTSSYCYRFLFVPV